MNYLVIFTPHFSIKAIFSSHLFPRWRSLLIFFPEFFTWNKKKRFLLSFLSQLFSVILYKRKNNFYKNWKSTFENFFLKARNNSKVLKNNYCFSKILIYIKGVKITLGIMTKNMKSIQRYSLSKNRFYGLRFLARPPASVGVNSKSFFRSDES